MINAGEIPSPTGREENLANFIKDRFRESELASISIDEAGNAAGFLPGSSESGRTILVAAHADKIWHTGENHTVAVSPERLAGRGIADNSAGVGALVSLPIILERLNIRLKSDLLLVGTTGSFGRGDLAGMRFFLDNTPKEICAGICLEGIQLGRLSFSSTAMLRGKIEAHANESGTTAGTVAVLSKIVQRILAIEVPLEPAAEILLGSLEAGSGYNVPPTNGSLRFEIRSEDAAAVTRIHQRISEIVAETDAHAGADCNLKIVATRTAGDIGFTHPLVKAAREIMQELDINIEIEPSISELSALLDRNIPGLTLGITSGGNRHTEEEYMNIEPMFTGLAQIVSTLLFIDNNDLAPNDHESRQDD